MAEGKRLGPLLLAIGLSLSAPAGAAPRKMAVAGSDLTIAAPKGFCVETDASKQTTEGTFVLFGSCAALAGSAQAGRPKSPAVLTAVVTPGAPDAQAFLASIDSLASFLTSEGGRKALSRSGRAETVSIRQISVSGDVLLVRLIDGAALAGQDVDPDYWRALFVLEGRYVTLSVLALRDMPLPDDRKRGLLDEFVRRVKAENPGSP